MDDQQKYLLVCVMEECAEIIQAASKCLRHGEYNHHPEHPDEKNITAWRKEIRDLRAVLMMMGEDRMYDQIEVAEKQGRVRKYMQASLSPQAQEE